MSIVFYMLVIAIVVITCLMISGILFIKVVFED